MIDWDGLSKIYPSIYLSIYLFLWLFIYLFSHLAIPLSFSIPLSRAIENVSLQYSMAPSYRLNMVTFEFPKPGLWQVQFSYLQSSGARGNLGFPGGLANDIICSDQPSTGRHRSNISRDLTTIGCLSITVFLANARTATIPFHG